MSRMDVRDYDNDYSSQQGIVISFVQLLNLGAWLNLDYWIRFIVSST